MKTKITFALLLLFASSVAVVSQDKKKKQESDNEECRGSAFFIGEQKDRFVTILGVHTEKRDTTGGQLLIWEHLGVKLYIDNNDKILDYSFMKANPEADPKRKKK